MKLVATVILFVGSILSLIGQEKDAVHIIPKPYSVELNAGRFTLNESTRIVLDGSSQKDIDVFIKQLRRTTGFAFEVSESNKKQANSILFKIDRDLDLPHPDGYILRSNDQQVMVEAKSPVGLFYGSQSLRQLLPTAVEGQNVDKTIHWDIPCVEIVDYPRFDWRGYMKDVSRTFYSVEVIKKYLDVMALYKLNVFHLHLTDDQGWRIEIKKYPELTSTKTTVFDPKHRQPAERSGFYTQDEIKELVSYAAERNITIVPEIDVPGHVWPIVLVKPELGTNQMTTPQYVFPFISSWGYWGFQFTPNPLDPTKEAVYTFLDDIFSEIVALFPSKYIHFGGDEVVHRLWEAEPHIQEFMKSKGMEKVEELQSYFVQRVSNIIIEKGRQPIGWNDILADADNLPKQTAIMSWLGAGAVKKAAENGFYTIAAPSGPLYFDITQDSQSDGTMSDLNYGAINSLDKVYNYDPERGLTATEKEYVLDVQANMWPAVPQEVKDINVQNFPRLIALSEIAWTSIDRKDFNDFTQRLQPHYARLDSLKMDYFRPGGYIVGHWEPATLSTDYKKQEWDVTKKVYANGRIMAGFFYTKGKSFLKVKNVKLLEDGQVISEDAHVALADGVRGIPYKKEGMFLYFLKVDNYNPQARYTLQAEIAGDTGDDSEGNVTFNLSPYEPFKVVETD